MFILIVFCIALTDRRPLGISMIFVGFETGLPQLYSSSPSGKSDQSINMIMYI